jgi:hypothetical protein
MPETTTQMETDGGVTTIAVTGSVNIAPDRVIEAVVDFTDRRERLFPAVSMKHMTTHALDATNADVTEGTRAGPFVFWERCTYDWSQPGLVVATVTDSNVYATPGSAWELRAEPTDIGSRVTMTWRRCFRRRPLGRFIGFVYRHDGKRAFTKYARDILDNLEQVVAATR